MVVAIIVCVLLGVVVVAAWADDNFQLAFLMMFPFGMMFMYVIILIGNL